MAASDSRGGLEQKQSPAGIMSLITRAVGEGPEGRTPGPDTLGALRWLQFTLIHLMFKCENSYAIVSGGFFTFLIKLVLIDNPPSRCCHLYSERGGWRDDATTGLKFPAGTLGMPFPGRAAPAVGAGCFGDGGESHCAHS